MNPMRSCMNPTRSFYKLKWNTMKKLFFIITGIIVMLAVSCNNTKLISSWKAPDATANKYAKVLVLGLTGAKDADIREPVENAVAAKLRDRGFNCVTATEQYGPRSFRKMDEDQAVKMVNDNGFDAVLVIALVDKDKERDYTPGYTTSTPYAVVRNRWYGYYSVLYDRVYTPGYYTTSTNYTLEANFYNTRGDKLIYSARAKSFDPNSAGDLAGDFSATIIKDMEHKGLIS